MSQFEAGLAPSRKPSASDPGSGSEFKRQLACVLAGEQAREHAEASMGRLPWVQDGTMTLDYIEVDKV